LHCIPPTASTASRVPRNPNFSAASCCTVSVVSFCASGVQRTSKSIPHHRRSCKTTGPREIRMVEQVTVHIVDTVTKITTPTNCTKRRCWLDCQPHRRLHDSSTSPTPSSHPLCCQCCHQHDTRNSLIQSPYPSLTLRSLTRLRRCLWHSRQCG
jgi:hypothetical protein